MSPEQIIPPCRVLMRNGVRCDEWIRERPAPELLVGAGRYVQSQPEKHRGRPRTRPPVEHPYAGKGQGFWNRRGDVTAEQIIELRELGLSGAQIAERLGCTRDLVNVRMRKYRTEHPEYGELRRGRKVVQ